MIINSKQHRKLLANQLVKIRNYEKSKGFLNYLKWLKSERKIKKSIQGKMRSFARGVDTEILAIYVGVDKSPPVTEIPTVA